MATLTHAGLEALWTEAAGAPQFADTAAAIAQAESGGDPSRIDNTRYPNRAGYHTPSPGAQPEYSVGLWQINLLAHPQYTQAQMLDPIQNANAAVAISNNGQDFGAWTTYTDGAYRQFLQSGGTPAGQPGGTTGDTAGNVSPHMHAGWADLRQSVNVHLPNQLRKSDTAVRATYSVLAAKSRKGR